MVLLILGLLLIFSHGAQAVERITSFHSDIWVHKNASMTVKETIDVVGESISIQHGIVREFPTRYKDLYGTEYGVQFDVKKVLLDGRSIPYSIEDAPNGKMIYIGDKDRYLNSGTFSFVIEYETNRQIGFFKKYDELYWNVTGTGWRLPIERASAEVHLPTGVPENKMHVEGFTGYEGSKGQYYKASVENGEARFVTTQPLRREQGLTIIVTWPKGFVQEPAGWDRFEWFLEDNKHVAVGFIGLLVLLFFYLFVWIAFRRSQELDTVIPLFYPPEHMSPGLTRYFVNMGYDAKVLAADILNMAVRGFLTIDYKPGMFWSGDYTLEKKEEPRGKFQELYTQIYQQST